jgi:hypothetical protein
MDDSTIHELISLAAGSYLLVTICQHGLSKNGQARVRHIQASWCILCTWGLVGNKAVRGGRICLNHNRTMFSTLKPSMIAGEGSTKSVLPRP